MSGPVLVRLTDKQRGALRALASVTVENGDGSPALAAAVAALDACLPAFTPGEYEALLGAVTDSESVHEETDYLPGGSDHGRWSRTNDAQNRALGKVRKMRARS